MKTRDEIFNLNNINDNVDEIVNNVTESFYFFKRKNINENHIFLRLEHNENIVSKVIEKLQLLGFKIDYNNLSNEYIISI